MIDVCMSIRSDEELVKGFMMNSPEIMFRSSNFEKSDTQSGRYESVTCLKVSRQFNVV